MTTTKRVSTADFSPSELLELQLSLAETDELDRGSREVVKRKPQKTVAASPALLIDAPKLAGLLSVSEATLYRMLAGGKIPAPLRLSRGCVRWHRETVERWLAASESQGRLIDRVSWETLCANTNGKPR